ncbi:Ribonuclease H-like domain [Lasallia pustulata]|uniref:ribonuclease H n=1 Tax=Lasallia pustulata TaxID=136370 RepID=A0A1W5D4C8_9LECA|nr:Ribonuclease H-like domain [Lasallia pustulata]
MSYPPESSIGQEVPIQGNYLDWNQNEQNWTHSQQQIHHGRTPLQNWQTSASKKKTDLVVKKHLTHKRQLIDQNLPIFYTDGSKLESNVNSQVKASLGAGTYWLFGKVTSSESHFVGHTQEIMDAEIYAIAQAIERIADAKTRKKHFWVFTDSQSAIQNLQKDQMETEVYRDMRQTLEEIKAQGRKVQIHLKPSHTFVPGNELADMAAKKGARNADPEIINSARTSISRSFIKRDIAKIAREEWTQYWKTTNQGQQYSKFQTNLELKMKSNELKQADRLTFTTFTQIKLGHGYFKSYLQYRAEQKTLKNTVLKSKTGPGSNNELSLKRLLCTREGIKATLAFLKETRIATRKWMLGEVIEEIEWGSIDREV